MNNPVLDLSEHILGKSDTPIETASDADNRALALALARQAQRRLLLFTHAPGRARDLASLFDTIRDRSTPDPALRALHI